MDHKILYIAPKHTDVLELVDDLIRYINTPQTDQLVKAINAYVTFLKIHPFTDGNGRTARALFESIAKKEARYFVHLSIFRLGSAPSLYDAMLNCGLNEGKTAHQSSFFKEYLSWSNLFKKECVGHTKKCIRYLLNSINEFELCDGFILFLKAFWSNPVLSYRRILSVDLNNNKKIDKWLFLMLNKEFLSIRQAKGVKGAVFESNFIVNFYKKIDDLVLIGKNNEF
ncbi:Fic family protein [Rheinheimera sp. D18]|uniref:Fic family protein n=1 Tax=Rheinheimera sp. D18 TaxID=2545632 RepID=UPI00325FE706